MVSPNVVFLVLDAVRADHVSSYGHDHETTPNIDRLADRGTQYDLAFANSNWTGASHASMFSGLLPSQSGVYGDNMDLPESEELLAELFRDAGYRTFATSAGAHIRAERGYDRGFDSFHETYRVRPTKDFLDTLIRDRSAFAQLVYSGFRGHDNYTKYKFDRLRRWIRSDETPFFAFVNCKTAHNPYNPPRPYKRTFCEDLDRPRFEFTERALEKLGHRAQTVPGVNDERLRAMSWEYPIVTDGFEPTNRELSVLQSWYDGAIRYLDERIGQFLQFLEDTGHLEDTYVVVTADHGELFGEHGLEKHHYSLYEPLLHVPLIIDPPEGGGAGPTAGRVTDPVSLVDLYPTLLDWADIDGPDRPDARTLSERAGSDEYLFAEVGSKSAAPVARHNPSFDGIEIDCPLQSVRDDQYKLVVSTRGRVELYNWRADPAEREDLSESKPTVRDRLLGAIDNHLEPMTEDALEEDINDPELQQHLEDLGYM